MDPRKFSALSNCGLHQNKDTSSYRIENQTQCHRAPTPRHTILNLVVVVQYPFQLCQQRSPFYYFYTYDPLVRTADDNKKKKMFYHNFLK
jgi:hypothetical protein